MVSPVSGVGFTEAEVVQTISFAAFIVAFKGSKTKGLSKQNAVSAGACIVGGSKNFTFIESFTFGHAPRGAVLSVEVAIIQIESPAKSATVGVTSNEVPAPVCKTLALVDFLQEMPLMFWIVAVLVNTALSLQTGSCGANFNVLSGLIVSVIGSATAQVGDVVVAALIK